MKKISVGLALELPKEEEKKKSKENKWISVDVQNSKTVFLTFSRVKGDLSV